MEFLRARGVTCSPEGGAEVGSGSTPALGVIQLDPEGDLNRVKRLLRAWEVRELSAAAGDPSPLQSPPG